jgi:hypothetical protein
MFRRQAISKGVHCMAVMCMACDHGCSYLGVQGVERRM